MKHLVLTVDYELFFGTNAGTVENSMIRPTRKLAEVLDKHGQKMTIFWDILHFYRLRELENDVKDLKIDRELIEKQIRWLVRQGHDVQMQIYPHWLDATWYNHRWHFNYNRFTIHRLWDNPEPGNIQTIMGCITQGRLLMEEVCQKEDATYKVRAFRGGGFRIEPFGPLAEALRANGILVDSTAALGLKSYSPLFPFDYAKMPDKLYYRFDNTIMRATRYGEFWEFPKETIKGQLHVRILFYILRNFFYTSRGRYGDGKRLSFTRKEQAGHLWSIIGSRWYLLSPVDTDPVRWNFLVSQARHNALVVLQAKNMSPFTINVMEASLASGQVCFHTLLERVKELNIYRDLH